MVSNTRGRLVPLFDTKRYKIDESFQRGAVDLVKYPLDQSYNTFKQLKDALLRIEGSERVTIGPFGVFPIEDSTNGIMVVKSRANLVNGTAPANGTSAVQESPSIGTNGSSTDDTIQSPIVRKRRLSFDDELFLKTNQSYVHAELLKYAKLTIIGIKGPNYLFNIQNMMHILYPKYIYNMDSDDKWVKEISVLDRLFSFGNGDTILVTKHFKALISDFKIDYHLTFVKNYFPNNYLDILVAPSIRDITLDIMCNDNYVNLIRNPDYKSIDLEDPAMLKQQIKLVIVYLVLCISSFNRYLEFEKNNPENQYGLGLGEDIQDDLHTSIELRKICVVLINMHLDGYDGDENASSSEYETYLLLAIFLQIQADTCFSIYENFEFLFAIGSHIVDNKYKVFTSSNNQLGTFLAVLFRIVKVFFESTHSIDVHNYSLEGRYNDSSSGDEDDGNNEVTIQGSAIQVTRSHSISNSSPASSLSPIPSQWYAQKPFFSKDCVDVDLVYLMYGIPKSLIDMFVEVVLLANDRKIFLSHMELATPPASYFRKCGRCERRIFNWERPLIPVDASPKQLKMYYNVLLFYFALKAYYLKIVKRARWYVYKEQVLELYKYFTMLVGIDDPGVKPIFWALLIAGSELPDKKDEIIEYWKCSQKSNYWRARQISYGVWASREDEEDSVDWMDKVREWDVVLCLV